MDTETEYIGEFREKLQPCWSGYSRCSCFQWVIWEQDLVPDASLFIGLTDLTVFTETHPATEWWLIRNVVYCCCPALQPPQTWCLQVAEYGELTQRYCLFHRMVDPKLLLSLNEKMQTYPAHPQKQNLGCVSQGVQVSPTDMAVAGVKARSLSNNCSTFRAAKCLSKMRCLAVGRSLCEYMKIRSS